MQASLLFFVLLVVLLQLAVAQYRGFYNNPFGLGFGSDSFQPIGDAARYGNNQFYYYNRNAVY